MFFAETVLSDDDIWRSGLNIYFKYTPQDEPDFGRNDHPVDLDAKNINTALKGLIFLDKKGFFSSEKEEAPVFSSSQINLLAQNPSKGLREAAPDQDIIFVMEGKGRKLFVLTDKTFVAGRAFYQDGKLNIILGEFDLPRNDAFESVYDPSGQGNIPYSFNHGSRARSSGKFEGELVQIAGINNKVLGNKLRQDWFVIDMDTAVKAVIAKQNRREGSGQAVDNEAIRAEAEKLARERREMRLEMARIRQEMNENQNGKNALSVEERLVKLNELRDKGLITEEEYASKREEILSDI